MRLWGLLIISIFMVESFGQFMNTGMPPKGGKPPESEYAKFRGPCIVYFNGRKPQTQPGQIEIVNSYIELRKRTSYTPYMSIAMVDYFMAINYKKNDIDPRDTDSLIFSGHVGYPSDNKDYWVFDKEIPIESSWKTRILFREQPHQHNPITLSKPVSEYPRDSIKNLLSVTPRLYVEFETNPTHSIQEFNKLKASQLIPTASSQVVCAQTEKIYSTLTQSIALSEINTLLALDSMNSIGHIALCIYHIQQATIPEAGASFERAKRLIQNPENDYLLYLAKLYFHEYQKEYPEALKAAIFLMNDKVCSQEIKNFATNKEKSLRQAMPN